MVVFFVALSSLATNILSLLQQILLPLPSVDGEHDDHDFVNEDDKFAIDFGVDTVVPNVVVVAFDIDLEQKLSWL